ncbi:MAG TPA: tetratricopeptide repeat protein [Bacteroidia bacterium]|nr:tetratricopeptide repeat protein [Bacteroidia bacterium]
MKKCLFFILLIACFCISTGQNLDSLWKIYNNKEQADTNRLKAIQTLIRNYATNDPDTAIVLAQLEEKLADLLPPSNKKTWIADALGNTGFCFMNKGDLPKALDYFLKSLKLYEEIQDKKGIGYCYVYLGQFYFYQSNDLKALEYIQKALKIKQDLGDKKGIGSCYVNIGNYYLKKSDYPMALDYYLKGLKILTEINNKKYIENCYGNIGNIYYYQLDYNKSLEYYVKALRIQQEINDRNGMAISYLNIVGVYEKLANYKLAMLYGDSALKTSKEIEDIDSERLTYGKLGVIYSKINKYKEAYEYDVKFKMLTDSMFNADNSKQLGDMKTQFEVEKKEAELKVKSEAEQEKLKAVASEEKKRQEVIIGAVAGILLVVVLFSFSLYRRFKLTQKQKEVIEEQKLLVDKAFEELHEKNKEVMDSIYYARKIQRALITPEKYIENSLNKLTKSK